MKKLTIPDVMKENIIKEIRRNDDSKYDHRLHGLLLVANGMSPYQASKGHRKQSEERRELDQHFPEKRICRS